jgi:gentisate 1,2-dioxygenase
LKIPGGFFRIEQGEAAFVFGGKEKHAAKDGDAVIVPAGTYHNAINTSKTAKLKLYTIYSPPIRVIGNVPGAHAAEIEGYRFSADDAEFILASVHYFIQQYFSKIDTQVNQYYTLTIDLEEGH